MQAWCSYHVKYRGILQLLQDAHLISLMRTSFFLFMYCIAKGQVAMNIGVFTDITILARKLCTATCLTWCYKLVSLYRSQFMKAKFQEKWYQFRRVHSTFLFDNTNNQQQSLTQSHKRESTETLQGYDTNTSADEMYSLIMYQSCAFVSISW